MHRTTSNHPMNYPPPIYRQDGNIELHDRKEQVTTGGGYRDWESGASHDPKHQAVPPPIAARPQRRRVNLSFWHVIALYGCCVFLATAIIALIVVITTQFNCATPYPAGPPLSFNSSITTTFPATSQQSYKDIPTTANAISTMSTETETVTSSSSHSIKIVTAPTVTVHEVTVSTAISFSTTKTQTT